MPETLNPSTIIIPQNRQRARPTDIKPLADSIKTLGQIQPIVVRQTPDGITLMVGYRRLSACKELGIDVKADFWEDLPELQAKIIELEENVKREDLHWRDRVAAVGNIHNAYKTQNPTQSIQQTADAISLDYPHTNEIMTVFKNLDSPLLRDATSIKQAYSILQVAAERRAASIVGEITKIGTQLFSPAASPETPPPEPDAGRSPGIEGGGTNPPTPWIDGTDIIVYDLNPTPTPSPTQLAPPGAAPLIICANFLDWIKNYSGPKFNLIHLDFPYEVKYDSYAKSVTSGSDEDYDHTGFFDLLKVLVENLDKIASYSAHIVCWFGMSFYEQTKATLKTADLLVHDHPLIWFKSDNSGIIPARGNLYPRRVYETAFLCSRNKRPLVKSLANCYAAPTPSNPIHPSQKSEPMLKHFFSMLVDETTDFLDPSCGSGSAVRAADDCGARSVFGLELDANMAAAAEAKTRVAQQLRKATR